MILDKLRFLPRFTFCPFLHFWTYNVVVVIHHFSYSFYYNDVEFNKWYYLHILNIGICKYLGIKYKKHWTIQSFQEMQKVQLVEKNLTDILPCYWRKWEVWTYIPPTYPPTYPHISISFFNIYQNKNCIAVHC